MLKRVSCLCWVALATVTARAVNAANQWTRLTLPWGVSIEYPIDWIAIGETDFRSSVDPLSPDDGFVVPNEARILVDCLGSSALGSMNECIAFDLLEGQVGEPSRVDLISAQDHVVGGCTELTLVIEHVDATPRGASQGTRLIHHHTTFYAAIGGQRLRVSLCNWGNDPRQSFYQQVAFRMARSLAVTAERSTDVLIVA